MLQHKLRLWQCIVKTQETLTLPLFECVDENRYLVIFPPQVSDSGGGGALGLCERGEGRDGGRAGGVMRTESNQRIQVSKLISGQFQAIEAYKTTACVGTFTCTLCYGLYNMYMYIGTLHVHVGSLAFKFLCYCKCGLILHDIYCTCF